MVFTEGFESIVPFRCSIELTLRVTIADLLR